MKSEGTIEFLCSIRTAQYYGLPNITFFMDLSVIIGHLT